MDCRPVFLDSPEDAVERLGGARHSLCAPLQGRRDRLMCGRIAEGTVSFCVVLLMFGTSSIADETAPGMAGEMGHSPGSAPSHAAECPDCPAGVEGDGHGPWHRFFPHFPLPSRSFSLFRSPVSYGWSYRERCAPTPWKPRGNGIPVRTSCFRMDYRPYELKHDASSHGPAFYRRFSLYPCPECPTHARHLHDYYSPRRW